MAIAQARQAENLPDPAGKGGRGKRGKNLPDPEPLGGRGKRLCGRVGRSHWPPISVIIGAQLSLDNAAATAD
jgi:hypothetical protein